MKVSPLQELASKEDTNEGVGIGGWYKRDEELGDLNLKTGREMSLSAKLTDKGLRSTMLKVEKVFEYQSQP